MNDRMEIEKHGGLYDIRPSLHLCRSANALFLKRLLDVAVEEKAPFHVWFHMWNFSKYERCERAQLESIQRSVKRAVFPLLEYAREKVDLGVLTFETMLSAAEKVESARVRSVVASTGGNNQQCLA
jgi:hypothetical protein